MTATASTDHLDAASASYEHGLANMMEYQAHDGSGASGHLALQEALKDIAPDVSRYIVEFAFGDIYDRPGLTNQERSLVTISSLTTLGTEPQVELHINSGLNVGLSMEQIVGAIVHLIPYIGLPKVLNALDIAKRAAAERGISVSAPQA